MKQLKYQKTYWSLFVLFHISLSQGCAFSSPFKGPGYRSSNLKNEIPSESLVVVAVTNARLNKSKAADDFRSESRDIYKNIEENEGYIGGSVRFKLFSDELWTLTVWRDHNSLKKFLDARRHANAMYMTNQGMTEFKHFNFEVAFKDIPKDWKLVDQKLSERAYIKHTPF